MRNTTCWRFSPVVIAVTIAVVLCPARSMAATIFSQTGTPDGSYTETSSEFWSQSFTLGGSPMVLTTVDVLLSGGAPSGQFFVDLYSNNSGAPGSFLEALSGNNDPQTAGTYTFNSTGSLLSANTTYWVVQGISSGGGFEYWNEENNNSPEVGSSIGAEYSFDSGASWNLQPGHSMQMVVNGTVAVPEASTIWPMLAGAFGSLLLVRRRRRE
jgi:hypothetical protein